MYFFSRLSKTWLQCQLKLCLPQIYVVTFQGIIPAENLKKILSQLPDTDEEEVDAMIAAIDDDGNGEVDFNGKQQQGRW